MDLDDFQGHPLGMPAIRRMKKKHSKLSTGRGTAFKKNKNLFFEREIKEAQAHEKHATKQSGVFETLEDAVQREGS